MKTLGTIMLFVGMAGILSASVAPEIDPGSAGTAVALLTGAVLMIKGRRKR